jgi:hypothetical protein
MTTWRVRDWVIAALPFAMIAEGVYSSLFAK